MKQITLICSECGKPFQEDERSLAGWSRIILDEKPICPDCINRKRKETDDGNE